MAESTTSLQGPFVAKQERPDDPMSWCVYGRGVCGECGALDEQPLVGDMLEGDARAIAEGLNVVRPVTTLIGTPPEAKP